MPTFNFQARDGAGALSSGMVMADSIAAAVQSLRSEGKYPTLVQPVDETPPRPWMAYLVREPRIGRKDLLLFITQLQIMIETGVTLIDALDSISAQAHKPNVRQVLSDISKKVHGGESFSQALGRHPRSFPRLLLALMAASEKSGLMSKLMGRAVAYLRDEQEIIRRVRGALAYPAMMLSFAIATTCFLMTFVLPKFTAIYASKGAALPVLTQFLMTVSGLLINQWMWIILSLIALVIGVWQTGRTRQGKRLFHYVQLNMPLLGKVFRKLYLARGLRLIGTMASSGINLPDCVHTANDLCTNVYFRDLWRQVSEQIQSGKQFSQPLFENPLVPKSMAQMLHSAEKGGKLASVMEQVSGYAEAELKEQITEMTRYIEPTMIVMMGAIIGTVALALMLPIFTISRAIVK